MTITISNLKVANNAPVGTVVGALTVIDDKGTVIPCNLTLTKQAAGYFHISSDDLVTHGKGRSNQVIIQSRFGLKGKTPDSAGPRDLRLL
jgi:hypothetical protein